MSLYGDQNDGQGYKISNISTKFEMPIWMILFATYCGVVTIINSITFRIPDLINYIAPQDIFREYFLALIQKGKIITAFGLLAPEIVEHPEYIGPFIGEVLDVFSVIFLLTYFIRRNSISVYALLLGALAKMGVTIWLLLIGPIDYYLLLFHGIDSMPFDAHLKFIDSNYNSQFYQNFLISADATISLIFCISFLYYHKSKKYIDL